MELEKFGTENSPGTSLKTKFGTEKSLKLVSKNLVPKKVSESVSEKIGTGKKSRNWYWKILVPEIIFVKV